jgi:hypothetical protein
MSRDHGMTELPPVEGGQVNQTKAAMADFQHCVEQVCIISNALLCLILLDTK